MQIDIDYKNIVEWMSQRHKISQDWSKKLKAAKLKTQQLVDQKNELKDSQIKEFIHKNQDSFNYYHLENTLQMHKQSDQGKQKNFFGGYSDKNVKEWDQLDKFYKKNNLHIIDLAKILSQNVTFEIPAIQKSIQNSEKQVIVHEQKIQDAQNSIKQLEQDYQKNCDKLGVKGLNLREEVPQMVKDLPKFFQEVTEKIQDPKIKNILEYYYQFTLYINFKQNPENMKLQILEYINRYGDDIMSIFEYRKITADIEIPEDLVVKNLKKYKYYENLGKTQQKQEIQANSIDWGAFQITSEGSGQNNDNSVTNDTSNNQQEQSQTTEINWGITVETEDKPQEETVQEIKWDITDTTTEQQKQNEENKIDWGISVENQASSNTNEDDFTEVKTIVSNIETRNQLISELNELYQFYKQRVQESKKHSTNSLLQMYDNNEENQNLFDVDPEIISQYAALLQQIIDLLTGYQFRQLLIIKEQPKSADRIIHHLMTYKDNIKKQNQNIKNFEKKIIQLEQLKSENKVKLTEYSNETVELKQLVETCLTAVIKNKIKIIGDINLIKKI